MTLDEMEKYANDIATDDTGDTNEREWNLARAVLRLLPVVRAAEKHEHVRRECQRTGRGHGALVLASEELEDAIDALHEEMRKE